MDSEKLPTAPVPSIDVCGVTVTSRYQKQNELDVMVKVVKMLPAWAKQSIVSIWRDSKACSCFTIDMADDCDRKELTRPLGNKLNELFLEVNGGHNGIYVGRSHEVNPDCAGDSDFLDSIR